VDAPTLRKKGGVPKNASLFFTIFQTFMTGEGDPVYKSYPSDFFDFIIIDECHRGGANDESQWRELLNWFTPAVQLGLTATPKRNVNADTYAYFGDPVYTYALKEGIEDGFLTPFKVRQMASTIDEYVYDPDDTVLAGEIEEDRKYTEADFNTRLIIEERERSRVQEFMEEVDQRQKAIIFCATQDHAARVRDYINQIKVSTDPNYCHRVTANDGTIGDQHLRNFQDNDKTVPTILTTSQKLSTGVDARNVRHIVLMRPVRSMIEFKQIIGRGTRTYDGKDFFTIWDFVKAHENFNDPEWDGPPEEIVPPKPRPPKGDDPQPDPDPAPPEPGEGGDDGGEGEREPVTKIMIKLADGKARAIQYIATTTYWGPDGRPISAAEFLTRLFGDLSGMVANEDQLRSIWSNPDNRERFLTQLDDNGYDPDRLDDIRRLVDAPKSDLYDVLSYILFANPPKTRHDRAETVRQDGMGDFTGEMKELLLGILKAYEAAGEAELSSKKLGQFLTARYGSVNEGKAKLGELQGKPALRTVVSLG
jgi:type I restriction enzyme R subunit